MVVLKRIVDGNLFTITNVYGPTAAILRADFFHEIRAIGVLSTGAWTVLGDFNVLLSVQDKNGPTANGCPDFGAPGSRFYIQFESYWLRHPAVFDVVSTAWNSNSRLTDSDPVSLFSLKINSVQSALSSWSAGDANTKFFHLKANARQNKNFISKLSNGSVTLSSPEPIAEHLFFFFYNQLGVAHDPSAKIDLHAVYGDETFDLSSLQTPFTLAEVKRAVFSSAPEKALGLDGLPMLFYQRFWNLLKDDIMSVFNSFYNNTAEIDLINTSWLCLIPKKKEALIANDFRPIGLLCPYTHPPSTYSQRPGSTIEDRLRAGLRPNKLAFPDRPTTCLGLYSVLDRLDSSPASDG
uniref:Reverse transcriptase n=1 Tax=Ananas comosus var. bracteatus TaxID=296719 RepID=A0A6V7PVD5_ANACO|nr:unnamed protein product [Ananas comosus var. bracteatus]